jgi:hypothetical protein
VAAKTTNACGSAAENRKFIRGRPIDSVWNRERARSVKQVSQFARLRGIG